jgi:hypothetical protein
MNKLIELDDESSDAPAANLLNLEPVLEAVNGAKTEILDAIQKISDKANLVPDKKSESSEEEVEEEEEEEEEEQEEEEEEEQSEQDEEDDSISFNVEWYASDKKQSYVIGLEMKKTDTVSSLQLVLMNRFGVHPNEMRLELADDTVDELRMLLAGSLMDNGVSNCCTVLFGLVGFDDDDSVTNEPIAFPIFVKWDKNKCVQVFKTSTVADLQAVLCDKGLFGSLEFGGKRLENGQTMMDYNIQRNKTLNLVKNLHGGGKKAVKKDLLKKVAQLKGENPLGGPITDEELLKACQVSTKVMKIKSVKFQEYFSALPLKVMTDIIEYLKHDKAHHRVKLESLHEFLPDVKTILAGASHFEAVADHMKEVVSNSVILNFTSADGTLDAKKVATELDVYVKLEELKQKDKMND